MAGRRIQPDIPYEAPGDGEMSKLCPVCNRVWPRRLMRGGTWRCINCARRYERGRTRPSVALRQNSGVADVELASILRAQGFACPVCVRRIEPPGEQGEVYDALVLGGTAYCRGCAPTVELFRRDPDRFRRVVAFLDGERLGRLGPRVSGAGGSMSVQDPRLAEAVGRDQELSDDVDRLIEETSRRKKGGS